MSRMTEMALWLNQLLFITYYIVVRRYIVHIKWVPGLLDFHWD